VSIKDDFQQASFQWPAWLIEAALFFIFSIFCWFSEIWNENENLPWLIWKNAGASTMKVQLILTVARHGQTIISKKTWRKRAALLLITKIYAPKFAIKTFSRINKAQVSLEIQSEIQFELGVGIYCVWRRTAGDSWETINFHCWKWWSFIF